ncbi:prepilin-type N-terminal cleavage/methylation domain-containing protein [Denitrificimonas caeni]|uniref:prepilin-type N-terminal cleavage/methylation domain-containing protein n=1 Tax=Denitrificimonas caeni TaxID=521720 RepID=UPI0019632D91|nr:prepilin-type N-terminal cleavage/methylation domain-containing protein [Denitrificimonas caeni]
MKQTANHSAFLLQRSNTGFALIELMIAMTLGLVLIGAATGIMLSNTQSFRSNKSLAQIQDSARLGFELMARDIRQAGSIPCGNDINLTNIVIDNPWYLDWPAGSKGQLIGYAGTSITTPSGLTNRVAGTEALSILYVDNVGSSVELTAAGTHIYTLNKVNNNFKSDDVVVVCDAKNGTLFKAKVENKSSKMTVAAASQFNSSTLPGIFEKHSVMGKLKSRAWYIGTNQQGGRSLYLAELNGSKLDIIEIAAGVSDLKLLYRLNDTADFKTTAEINDHWPQVNAIEVSLELLGQEQNVSTNHNTDSGRFKRSFTSIVALRNRIL